MHTLPMLAEAVEVAEGEAGLSEAYRIWLTVAIQKREPAAYAELFEWCQRHGRSWLREFGASAFGPEERERYPQLAERYTAAMGAKGGGHSKAAAELQGGAAATTPLKPLDAVTNFQTFTTSENPMVSGGDAVLALTAHDAEEEEEEEDEWERPGSWRYQPAPANAETDGAVRAEQPDTEEVPPEQFKCEFINQHVNGERMFKHSERFMEAKLYINGEGILAVRTSVNEGSNERAATIASWDYYIVKSWSSTPNRFSFQTTVAATTVPGGGGAEIRTYEFRTPAGGKISALLKRHVEVIMRKRRSRAARAARLEQLRTSGAQPNLPDPNAEPEQLPGLGVYGIENYYPTAAEPDGSGGGASPPAAPVAFRSSLSTRPEDMHRSLRVRCGDEASAAEMERDAARRRARDAALIEAELDAEDRAREHAESLAQRPVSTSAPLRTVVSGELADTVSGALPPTPPGATGFTVPGAVAGGAPEVVARARSRSFKEMARARARSSSIGRKVAERRTGDERQAGHEVGSAESGGGLLSERGTRATGSGGGSGRGGGLRRLSFSARRTSPNVSPHTSLSAGVASAPQGFDMNSI